MSAKQPATIIDRHDGEPVEPVGQVDGVRAPTMTSMANDERTAAEIDQHVLEERHGELGRERAGG